MTETENKENRLLLIGQLSDVAQKKISENTENEAFTSYFFASFSEIEIFVNTQFEVIFAKNNPQNHSIQKIQLLEAKIDGLFSLPAIPKGYKTVLALQFENKDFFEKLEKLNHWHEKKTENYYISSRLFWENYCQIWKEK